MIEYPAVNIRQALRLYKKGWGCKRISYIIGCYPSTVKRWVEKAGLDKHPGPAHPKALRKKLIAEYQRRTDMSLERLAREHGVGHESLRRWLRDAKVPIRSQRPTMFNRDAILADIKEGLPKGDIASRHGCSESWVYRIQAGH